MMLDVSELVGRTKAELRPYQERIVAKVFTQFNDKQLRAVLIESPTGSGKTIMALMCAKALHEQLGLRIGWVAMRRHLLDQAKHENELKQFNVPLTFMSMFDKKPPSGLDMLIVDEAQHDVTGSMMHIHTVVKPRFILGMTATPFRHDRVKLCFDSVIKDAGIPTLIQDGYLSSYHHYTIPEWTVDTLVDFYVKDPTRWGVSIMYFHRLEQCYEAERKLLTAGVPCTVVSGASDAEQQIADFHAGKYSILLNCMKLTEGFDAPHLKTVFCRPSCKPVTVQMAGRVLRKHPDHPYKQIVQAQKTPYPFQRTALAVMQHIHMPDGWRTLEVNKDLDKINQRTIRALAHIKTEMPKYILDAKRKAGARRWSGGRQAQAARLEEFRNSSPEDHMIFRGALEAPDVELDSL
jgi:superfamily II DNA or RNA helicase